MTDDGVRKDFFSSIDWPRDPGGFCLPLAIEQEEWGWG